MPLISRSIALKVVATILALLGFVLLYETTVRESRPSPGVDLHDPMVPGPGSRLRFTLTAYCKGTTTASGVNVRRGIAAADPALLPIGSVVSLSTTDTRYNGIYTVMDTGPAVQGRVLDLYMWSCHEALAFGRRDGDLTVLRLGWNPKASTPGTLADRADEPNRADGPYRAD